MLLLPKILIKPLTLDKIQKEILVSTLVIVLASIIIASVFRDRFVSQPFLEGITIFFLQHFISRLFSSKAILIRDDRVPHLYQDKRHGKIFAKTSMPLLCSGLAQVMFIFSCCTYKSSMLSIFILLLPLFITRWMLFTRKLPLSVLYISDIESA